MIEAAMIWNEPNNKSHWAFELDPDWSRFAEMAKLAGQAIRAENPRITRVLGGISPIDASFIKNMERQGVLDHVDAIAIHGFPLDWNHWQLEEWPARLAEIQAVTDKPVWISEVGISTFGADWVQEMGLVRTVELLRGKAPRIHWYSLMDLPKAWPATTRHREAEGSSYYRHFYMGMLREDGTPKSAARRFAELTPDIGICQWFHFEDHRLDDAVCWLKQLNVTHRHPIDERAWDLGSLEEGAGEPGAGPRMRVLECLVVGCVVLDARVGLADEPLDVVEQARELGGGGRVAVEAQRPLPGIEGVVEVGADERPVDVVELPGQREHAIEPRLVDRAHGREPLRAQRDLLGDRGLDDQLREPVAAPIERPEVEVVREPRIRR
jgi:hypothetical protein